MTDQNNSNQAQTAALDQKKRNEVALIHFAETLLKDRNDSNIKPEDLPTVREALLLEVNDHINRWLIAALDEKYQIELDHLLDKKPSDEEVDRFLEEKIPDMDVEIAKALLSFRNAYLAPLDVPMPAPVAK